MKCYCTSPQKCRTKGVCQRGDPAVEVDVCSFCRKVVNALKLEDDVCPKCFEDFTGEVT